MRHRPFWLEMFSGKMLCAWGIYVLLMPIRLGQVPAFAVVDELAFPNFWVGSVCTTVGAVQIGAVLVNIRAARIVCCSLSLVLWWATELMTRQTGQPHPGTVLYAEPIVTNLFALCWLIYDFARRK